MNLKKVLKPTKWKVLVSITPFLMPVFFMVLFYMIDNDKNIINLDFSILLQDIGGIIVFYVGYPLSIPLKPIIAPLGLWESSAFLGPTVPTLGGYIAVATTYSILIYLTWSLISFRMGGSR